MLHQTENLDTSKVVKPKRNARFLKRTWHGFKNYWLLLLVTQLPLVVISIVILRPQPAPALVKDDGKAIELQNNRFKNLEKQIKNLNERFLNLQSQYLKTLTTLKSENNFQKYPPPAPQINQTNKQTLEVVDRIGEKIRLNEPFIGLLTSLSKECMNFSGYKSLHKYATKLPLTFAQLKKSFDEIYKNYTPPKQNTNLPIWLKKIASFFHGKIKIEQTNQTQNNPMKPINEALEVQDLKLAFALAKDINVANTKLWMALVQERISLEEEYSIFAEKVHEWAQQTFVENQQPVQLEKPKQENTL